MTQSTRRRVATQEHAATNARNFRTFLLMEQFAAKEIGARIAQTRLERGLTQDDLAAMASFSKRSLQDYEGGVTIPYKHMREISRLLKKPQHWFLYGDEEASSSATDPPNGSAESEEPHPEEAQSTRAILEAILATVERLEKRQAG